MNRINIIVLAVAGIFLSSACWAQPGGKGVDQSYTCSIAARTRPGRIPLDGWRECRKADRHLGQLLSCSSRGRLFSLGHRHLRRGRFHARRLVSGEQSGDGHSLDTRENAGVSTRRHRRQAVGHKIRGNFPHASRPHRQRRTFSGRAVPHSESRVRLLLCSGKNRGSPNPPRTPGPLSKGNTR